MYQEGRQEEPRIIIQIESILIACSIIKKLLNVGQQAQES